ncbi:MAG: DUF4382 domain-containing protein [Anaeromyxobacter sp.]
MIERAAALAMALAAGACGSGSGGAGAGGGTGRLSVHLVDAPTSEYQQVNVDVRAVEIATADGWVTLSEPHRVIDLLSLTGGVVATLADGVTLPAGHYGQLRLVLGPDNSVVLADGTPEPLKVPSGQQSGIKLTVDVDVAPGTTADIFIDFDAHRSVFVHEAGKSGKYILRPVIRAVDRTVTGTIHGQLVDGAGGAPLPGVTVMAQVHDAGGAPAVLRATSTDGEGRYALDLVPLGVAVNVVAQPVVGEVSYLAAASGAITLTEAAPVVTRDAAFTAAPAVGGIAGTVAPAAGEADADTVVLWQVLDAGGTPAAFVIRTTPGLVAAGAETFGFASLPAGAYSVGAQRRTLADDGSESVVTGATQPATVVGGADTPVALTVP